MPAKQRQRLAAVDMTLEKRIQPVMNCERAHAHFRRRFDTAAPAAAEDHPDIKALAAQIIADAARLVAAGLAEIALRAAVIDAETGGIAKAGRQRVPQEQHIGINLLHSIGQRPGLLYRLRPGLHWQDRKPEQKQACGKPHHRAKRRAQERRNQGHDAQSRRHDPARQPGCRFSYSRPARRCSTRRSGRRRLSAKYGRNRNPGIQARLSPRSARRRWRRRNDDRLPGP